MIGIKSVNNRLMCIFPIRSIRLIEREVKGKVLLHGINKTSIEVRRVVPIGLFAKIWWYLVKKRLNLK